jgi:hypothetical protein
VVFTTGTDCGRGRWEKVPGLEGRVIMAVGTNQKPGELVPGRTKVKLKAENIPAMAVRLSHKTGKADIVAGQVSVVSELSSQGGDGLKQEILRVGTLNNEEVDITPPGVALTVCHRRDQ